MASSYLEIVELENGDIVLQRSDDDDQPLVRIQFSEESRLYMNESSLEIARVMIQAGIQAAASLAEEAEVELEEVPEEQPRILH